MKDKPWKDLIKKGFLENLRGFTKEELFMKSKEYGLCHHCKYLYPEEYLIKCNFRSTDLKLSTTGSEYMNPLSYHGIALSVELKVFNVVFKGTVPKRSTWNNKRIQTLFYRKKSGSCCIRILPYFII